MPYTLPATDAYAADSVSGAGARGGWQGRSLQRRAARVCVMNSWPPAGGGSVAPIWRLDLKHSPPISFSDPNFEILFAARNPFKAHQNQVVGNAIEQTDREIILLLQGSKPFNDIRTKQHCRRNAFFGNRLPEFIVGSFDATKDCQEFATTCNIATLRICLKIAQQRGRVIERIGQFIQARLFRKRFAKNIEYFRIHRAAAVFSCAFYLVAHAGRQPQRKLICTSARLCHNCLHKRIHHCDFLRLTAIALP
ncbi:hypothetical protein C7441_12145 [Pseudaminobacter salicylatoxidans]|uniref:Uncharacterized protein n=1 Tax=Pseudaminobacter salicylatoxidans TaxID=93369 RepID=A0A316CAP3_PSESE|nr:hypothetical protein C7441_12145 [Pseudaminobacter salicylatoxidans]